MISLRFIVSSADSFALLPLFAISSGNLNLNLLDSPSNNIDHSRKFRFSDSILAFSFPFRLIILGKLIFCDKLGASSGNKYHFSFFSSHLGLCFALRFFDTGTNSSFFCNSIFRFLTTSLTSPYPDIVLPLPSFVSFAIIIFSLKKLDSISLPASQDQITMLLSLFSLSVSCSIEIPPPRLSSFLLP